MDERPLVTCYIETFNCFDDLYFALDSILQQTYPNIEVAICDDCSEAFPGREIEQYIKDHKRENIKNIIVYQNETNIGTVKNDNKMIRMTSGRYLIGMGQDDFFYDKNVVLNVVNFFIKHDSYLVTSYREIVNENNQRVKRTPTNFNAKRITRADAGKLYRMIAAGVSIAGVGTFFDRRIFDEIGIFDEEFLLQEDGPFFLKATRLGYKIDFYEGVTLCYRMGRGVSSGKRLHPQLINDIYKLYAKEVDPYIERLNFLEKRSVQYQKERLKCGKSLCRKDAIRFCVKYPDVVLYRWIFSH